MSYEYPNSIDTTVCTAPAMSFAGDFALPKPEWQFRIGDLTVPCVTAPNRFHRAMQRICLGIEWEKIGV